MTLKRSLVERLNQEGAICAEGFLFEMERRGYLTAGEFVPEVSLEYPEALKNLHKDFQHAGSDIVEAFTYNGHREKMRVIGKEELLEPLNRAALKIAKEVKRLKNYKDRSEEKHILLSVMTDWNPAEIIGKNSFPLSIFLYKYLVLKNENLLGNCL